MLAIEVAAGYACRGGAVGTDEPQLGPDLPGRSPDVMFIFEEHLDRMLDTHIQGPADLVIEVVGPNSQQRDKVTKYGDYQAAGVPEYWWIDYPHEQTGFFTLNADGLYEPIDPDAEGWIVSRVLPMVRVRPEWFWQDPLPKVSEVLRAWGVIGFMTQPAEHSDEASTRR